MVRDDRTANKLIEIKRQLATGRYRVDPLAVAEAMIRRGEWDHYRYRRPPIAVPLPKRTGNGST